METDKNKKLPNEKSLQDFTDSENSPEKDEKRIFSGACDKRCRICSAGHAVEVRTLQRQGKDLAYIVNFLREKYGFEASIAGTSRHLKNYKTELIAQSFENAIQLFEKEKENLARHQAGILLFIDVAFRDIFQRYKQGYYEFDVAELKGLLELFYKVLQNPDRANDDDVLALFQKFNSQSQITEQGILFRPSSFSEQCRTTKEDEKRSEKEAIL